MIVISEINIIIYSIVGKDILLFRIKKKRQILFSFTQQQKETQCFGSLSFVELITVNFYVLTVKAIELWRDLKPIKKTIILSILGQGLILKDKVHEYFLLKI